MSRPLKKRLTEKKIWNKLNLLQKELPGAHFTKIESSTINGIPDVHCCYQSCSFWLELKANDSKDYGISRWQMNWHSKHNELGGNAFILLKPRKQKGLKLLRVEGRSVDLVAEGEDNYLTLRLLISRCVSR